MITAMGIGMRCLELVGNLIAFGLIFGYPLAGRRRRLIAGAVSILAVMLPVLMPNWVPQVYITPVLMYAVAFVLFEKVRLRLVVAFDLAKSSLRNLCMGILTAMVAFPIREIEGWYKASLVNNCTLLLLFALAAFFLRNYRDAVHRSLKQIPLWCYLLMCVVLYLPTYTYWTSSTLEQDVLRMEGILTIVDGIIGFMIAGLIVLIVILWLKEKELKQKTELNERCIEEQTQQYCFLNEKQQEMKKFRHDSKAHLSAIYALSENEGSERIREYVSRLIAVEEELKHFDTGSIIGDAVVNQYYGLGLKEGIEVKMMGSFAENFSIPETDLCVILTNTVSNAYEAAQRCSDGAFVDIGLTHYRGLQFIRITNPSPDSPDIENGRLRFGRTSKAEKERHGLGVQSICDAVERNNGEVRWTCELLGAQYLITTEIQLPITK